MFVLLCNFLFYLLMIVGKSFLHNSIENPIWFLFTDYCFFPVAGFFINSSFDSKVIRLVPVSEVSLTMYVTFPSTQCIHPEIFCCFTSFMVKIFFNRFVVTVFVTSLFDQLNWYSNIFTCENTNEKFIWIFYSIRICLLWKYLNYLYPPVINTSVIAEIDSLPAGLNGFPFCLSAKKEEKTPFEFYAEFKYTMLPKTFVSLSLFFI